VYKTKKERESLYTKVSFLKDYNFRHNKQKLKTIPLPLFSAYLLISHGSRDPRPQQAIAKLAELIRLKLEAQSSTRTPTIEAGRLLHLSDSERTIAPAVVVSSTWYPLVDTATLELGHAPLHEQIRQFASVALAAGCNQLQLLPLFLLPGVHVMEDIPEEVALALTSLGGAIAIKQLPYLGAHPGLRKILAKQLATGKRRCQDFDISWNPPCRW
jgi:sirohydrochlorin cobaltochelatase